LNINKTLLIFDRYLSKNNIMNMKFNTKTRTGQVLAVMHVLAWVAFIGFLINAGAILVSTGVSLVNADAAKDLYRGLDLSHLRQMNWFYYMWAISLMLAIPVMKAMIWLLVIRILSVLTPEDPFKMEVAQKLERISYLLLGTWIVGMVGNVKHSWFAKITGELPGVDVSEEFIFMAGLVFIISQVFKRGVEIQSENDLTV
jgi:hypothetical protein